MNELFRNRNLNNKLYRELRNVKEYKIQKIEIENYKGK